MTTIGYAVIAAAVCLAAAVVFWDRRRLRRTMRRLDEMLDAAIRDEFRESSFDESLLSSVEAKLADYLSASAVSAGHLRTEKENVKALISDISHQTKTPLANILLYTQLLSEQDLPGEGRACAAALEGQAEKLQTLMDSLVKLSRLESGMLTFHTQAGPLSPMLEAAAAGLRPKADEKGLALLLRPTDAAAVFDRKWTEEGVGVGLYLVRQIAAGQGGYVKVFSKPGKGAKFSLFLPRS